MSVIISSNLNKLDVKMYIILQKIVQRIQPTKKRKGNKTSLTDGSARLAKVAGMNLKQNGSLLQSFKIGLFHVFLLRL